MCVCGGGGFLVCLASCDPNCLQSFLFSVLRCLSVAVVYV